MIYNIPQVGLLELDTIVFDLNGTLTVRGELIEGVKERIEKLKLMGFQLFLFSGDQRDTAEKMSLELGLKFKKATSAQQKEELMNSISSTTSVAIGNARIDIGMFKKSKLAICTLQGEGIHTEIIKYADIITTDINDALDLFIYEDSLKATMRR